MRGVNHVLSMLATGAVTLFVAFALIAGVNPADVVAVTIVVAALAVFVLVRNARLEYELRSQGGDPQLRSAHNHQRERRGF